MPPMEDWLVYTSMAATEGSAFSATASASVWFSLPASMTLEVVDPSCVDCPPSPEDDPPVAVCQMPKPPRPMTQASAAPANATPNVRPLCDFFSTVTGVCCGCA